MKTLDWHAGMAKESIENSRERIRMYNEIDKHRLGKWQPPMALKELAWIKDRNFSSTAPADALDAGARAFATLMPKITIDPLDETPAGYEDAERKETALDWHFKKMNMFGKKTTHWQILESAMRYCAVAFETEYLPYAFKDRQKDKRIRNILRGSAMRWTVHHPATIHARNSKFGLESVVLEKQVSYMELADEFGEDNPGVAQLKKDVFKDKMSYADKLKKDFFFYKSTDWDERAIWVAKQSGGGGDKHFKILHKEHALDFIPWVVIDNEDSILKNAINTGLLDNLNIMRLLSYAAAVAMVASSQQWIRTTDGTLRGVHIDNQNPTQPLVTDQSVEVTALPQQRPNDAMENKVQQATQEVYTSTVAQILADANKLAGSENFSTTNLAFKIALGSLSLAKDAAERAEETGFFQLFQWIDHAGDVPLTAYRDKGRRLGEEILNRGELITINKGDFDIDRLYIDVKLREFSSMDEQAKWNLAVTQVERLGFSREVLAEELGVENYALHEEKRAVEDLTQAMIQADAQRELSAVEVETQAAIMQIQMGAQQAQQEQAGGQPPPEPGAQVGDMNAAFPGAQGIDPRGGGAPPSLNNPNENRVSITGTDDEGGQLA